MVVQNHPNAEPDEIAKMIAGRDVNQIGLDAFNGFTENERSYASFAHLMTLNTVKIK